MTILLTLPAVTTDTIIAEARKDSSQEAVDLLSAHHAAHDIAEMLTLVTLPAAHPRADGAAPDPRTVQCLARSSRSDREP